MKLVPLDAKVRAKPNDGLWVEKPGQPAFAGSWIHPPPAGHLVPEFEFEERHVQNRSQPDPVFYIGTGSCCHIRLPRSHATAVLQERICRLSKEGNTWFLEALPPGRAVADSVYLQFELLEVGRRAGLANGDVFTLLRPPTPFGFRIELEASANSEADQAAGNLTDPLRCKQPLVDSRQLVAARFEKLCGDGGGGLHLDQIKSFVEKYGSTLFNDERRKKLLEVIDQFADDKSGIVNSQKLVEWLYNKPCSNVGRGCNAPPQVKRHAVCEPLDFNSDSTGTRAEEALEVGGSSNATKATEAAAAMQVSEVPEERDVKMSCTVAPPAASEAGVTELLVCAGKVAATVPQAMSCKDENAKKSAFSAMDAVPEEQAELAEQVNSGAEITVVGPPSTYSRAVLQTSAVTAKPTAVEQPLSHFQAKYIALGGCPNSLRATARVADNDGALMTEGVSEILERVTTYAIQFGDALTNCQEQRALFDAWPSSFAQTFEASVVKCFRVFEKRQAGIAALIRAGGTDADSELVRHLRHDYCKLMRAAGRAAPVIPEQATHCYIDLSEIDDGNEGTATHELEASAASYSDLRALKEASLLAEMDFVALGSHILEKIQIEERRQREKKTQAELQQNEDVTFDRSMENTRIEPTSNSHENHCYFDLSELADWAPSCLECGKDMVWSDYAEDAYATGFFCSNSRSCVSGHSTAGNWRWFCQICSVDYCFRCHPAPKWASDTGKEFYDLPGAISVPSPPEPQNEDTLNEDIPPTDLSSRIIVRPSIYNGPHREGDFHYELTNKTNLKALYIFADNVEEHQTSIEGSDSAKIRAFNVYGRGKNGARAAGICTSFRSGSSSGFSELTDHARKIIDSDIEEIKELLQTRRFEQVVYSSSAEGELVTSALNVGSDVKRYVVKQLNGLATVPEVAVWKEKPRTDGSEPRQVCQRWIATDAYAEVNVRKQNTFDAEILCTKSQHTAMQGVKDGGWVKLTDEPGYVAIQDRDGRSLLRIIESWTVADAYAEVNVRKEKTFDAEILCKKKGSTSIHGVEDGGWVKLTDEPGYVAIQDRDGSTLLRVIECWTVTDAYAEVDVRREKTFDAEILCKKSVNATMHGVEDDGWVKLTDEPGYVAIQGKHGEPLVSAARDSTIMHPKADDLDIESGGGATLAQIKRQRRNLQIAVAALLFGLIILAVILFLFV